MTEQLIGERLSLRESARLDDACKELHALDKSLAVLRTEYDQHVKASFTTEHRDCLWDEMENHVNKAMGHICDHLTGANVQQSKDLLAEVRGMLSDLRSQDKDEQLKHQQAVINAITERRSKVVWWVLGIVGGLIVAVASTLFGVWIAMQMNN